MLRARPSIVAFVAALLAGMAGGCGDDSDDQSSAAGNPARYCQLSKELDRAGQTFFAQLEKQNANAREFAAAERQFVKEHQADLEKIEGSAPQELGQEVSKLLAGTRARAGIGPSVPEDELAAAERRVQAYEKANC
jgi:hypothetical protein